ncbi:MULTISPECIES: hypothetical protein [Corallococcus]|uniref:hypothetical protein n=1 Tax=Corallococcus TaxID=83461 RepID=UPI001F403CAF|nr:MULTISPECIES: hypothetical protein [Corallococcus]
MKTTWVGAVVVAGFASGCATPYQRMGIAGGYRDTEVAPGVIRIEVRGNAMTSVDTLVSYFHRRAGEICAPREYDFRLGLGATRDPSTFTATERNSFMGKQVTVTEQPGYSKGWVTGLIACMATPDKASTAVAAQTSPAAPPEVPADRVLAIDVETGELGSVSEASAVRLSESRKLAPVTDGKVIALTPEGARVKVDAVKAEAALTLGYHILSGAELAAEQRAAMGQVE